MAIKFFNVRTGETRTVDTEPMMSAFYNSSDQHVNATLGQDFGWRLAPETIKRMRDIQADRGLMDHIKTEFQLADDVKNIDILRWVSLEDARKEREDSAVRESDYTRQYEDDVRALDRQNRVSSDPNPSQPAGAEGEVPREEDRKVEDMVAEEGKKSSKPKKQDGKSHTVNRSAKSGEFVSEEEAKDNPDTTETETIKD